jgi:RNA polymerase sigma-70 factor (ECF subfamily)
MMGTPDRDDVTVVHLVRQGDAAAFEALFLAHYEALVGYATTFLHSVDAARDVVCEVYAIVWEIRSQWAPVGPIRAYLFGAVRNRTLNALRDQERHETLLRAQPLDMLPLPAPMDTTVDDDLEREARWTAIRQAIEGMRGMRGEAMRLRWVHQLSQAEVAQILGISLNAVQQHLSLALKILRQEFGGEG